MESPTLKTYLESAQDNPKKPKQTSSAQAAVHDPVATLPEVVTKSQAANAPAVPQTGTLSVPDFDALFQTSKSWLDLDPTYSWRPLDSAWQFAVRLWRRERLPSEYKTRDAVSALRAIRELKKHDPAFALLKMKERFPNAVGAIALRLHPQPIRRWELEARVLARQTPQEIGACLGYPAGAIEQYERWFYGARQYLDARGWVRHHAIRTYVPSVDPTEELLKHYAYIGGPHVLDRFLAVMLGTSQNPNRTAADINRYFRDESRENLQVKAAIAMHQLEVNPSNVVQVSKHYVRTELRDRRRAAKQPGIDPVSYQSNIAAMLRGLHWTQDGRDRTGGGLVGELLESLNPAHA